jgi:hypothetical protein
MCTCGCINTLSFLTTSRNGNLSGKGGGETEERRKVGGRDRRKKTKGFEEGENDRTRVINNGRNQQ